MHSYGRAISFLLVGLCMRSASAFLPGAPAAGRLLGLRMNQKGFGTSQPKKKISEIGQDRKRVGPDVLGMQVSPPWQAADKYEALKSEGAPEFNIFFRKIGATDEDGAVKGGWYPVGSLACPSSQVIDRALFETEEALLQGAYRIHGKQIRNYFSKRDGGKVNNWQDLKDCDIEYGWQLKEYADEDIRVAQRPGSSQSNNFLGGLFKKIEDTVNWVPDKE